MAARERLSPSTRRPLVSLVMAAWNPRPEWARASVESALGQRDCELELVVVDDGNPEPVENLLADVDDARLRIVRVEHGGESRARNAGIAAAAGDVFRFVDVDDVLEPGSTARLLALLGGRDDLIAYGATMFCDADLTPRWKLTARVEGDAREQCLLGRFPVRPFSMLFPRAVVEAVGGWDDAFTVSQDWDYVLRAVERASVRGETEVATFYRKHGAAATSDQVAGEDGARLVVARYFERHPEERSSRLERRARASLDARSSRVHASHGRPAAALKAAARSLRRGPGPLLYELRLGAGALAGEAAARFR